MSYVNENSLILGKPSYSSVWPFPSSIGPLDNVTTTNLDVTTINGLSYPPPPGTGFVTLTGVETLSNKSLIDNSTFIIDVTDASKRIGFDAAGTASTTLTLRATQSANRTYTMADMGADTNFMFTGGTQTVTGNKSFSASTLRVVNSTDASVYTTFTTGTAPAGTVATISTSGLAASRTYNLVDAGGTTDFVLTGGTQTLTGTKIFPETARMSRAADTTTYMRFTPGASPAGTVTTIATAVQSGSRTYTIPDSSTNTEFVLAASSQTLSNKKFQDSGTFIVDIVDPTIRIGFDAAGAAGSTLTLRATNTTSRTYTMPDMGENTSFVFTEGAQTLSSKALDDATTTIVASGGTATIAFNSAGTAGTSTTIRSTQTASSVFSFPNTTTVDEIVLADATQNLTNKGFASDTTYFYNPTVPTKRISFDPSGLNAGVTYTIRAAAGAASRVFSLPNTANDTFAFLAAAQTLTNKTLTSTTNNIVANQLRTTTGTVGIGGSPAPNVGDVLTAISSIAATWQPPTASPTTFSDTTFAIYDNVDNTTQILFDAAGTAATTATIRSAQTASRIYTIPDAVADDSFVLLTPAQTLTNKTITDVTNTVAAKQLIDATGVVDVSASAAPSAGQTLVASSATVAAWATPSVTTVTGILPVANGGTGVATLTSGNVLVGAGTSNVTTTKAAPTGDFVGTTDSQNLTNKGLADNSTRVYAASNSTIFINFDAGGTASTGTTFVVRQSANRNINFLTGAVNCNALLSEGAQTVNGVNTFTAGILTPTITETVANAGTTINSINLRTVVSGGVNVGVVESTAANSHLALLVTGSGAITAQIPNAAASGGVSRGAGAVDFQTARSAANQVAQGVNSAILGGNANRVAAAGNAVIVGGNINLITGGATNSGILCGLSNTINSNVLQGVIAGGARNSVAANFGGVLAGDSNNANGARSAVGGGDTNTASGSNSFVGGGNLNAASATQSGVLAGASNNAGALNAVVCGGDVNGVGTGGTGGFIGGGNGNSVGTAAYGGNVCGTLNQVTGLRSLNGAGTANVVSGTDSFNAAGTNNTSSGTYATVFYGASNTATAQYTCSGGRGAQSTADGCITFTDSLNTTTTNSNANRAVFRFDNGYRLITTSAFRLNTVEYTYSNLIVTSAGINGNTVITNSTITVRPFCAFRFIIRMQGQYTTAGAILPGGAAGSHVMMLEGYGGADPNAANMVIGTITASSTNTNYTNANLIGTSLNAQIQTLNSFRFRINAGGTYDPGFTMRWVGSVILYMNDFGDPDSA